MGLLRNFNKAVAANMTTFLSILFLSVIVLWHELGHFILAKIFKVKVEEFGLGFPPKIFSKKIGETKYSLNLLPFGGFNRISPPDLESKPAYVKAAILFAGALANVLFGFLLFVFIYSIGAQPALMIVNVFDNSSAQLAGLQEGDQIISLSHGQEVLSAPIDSQEFKNFVALREGETLNLTVKRDGAILDFALKSPLGIGFFNVSIQKLPFLQGLKESFLNILLIFRLTFIGLFQILFRAFQEPQIIENIVGPVGMVFYAQRMGNLGFIYFLQMMALVSIGLAAINLAPIPALDGMHLVFLLIEKIKGSPISLKIRQLVNGGGLLLILFLAILLIIKDIRLFL